MAKKRIIASIKFQVEAQKATPAPPVGSSLGPHGVSAPVFVKQFNDVSKKYEAGLLVTVVVSVYADKSFSFIIKSPPAAVLIKKEIALEKGSSEPHKTKVGTISMEKLKKIAEIKMNDLNANDIDAAVKIIAGTARSMGVEVEKVN